MAQAAAAEDPAVARPRFTSASRESGGGTAFFLAVPQDPGAVAVTTAHALDFALLAGAKEVSFDRGNSEERISVSSRLFAKPGQPFSAPGATLRDDYLVFALDTPLLGARTLTPESRDPAQLAGKRVRILGVPAGVKSAEDDLFGVVKAGTAQQIEVMLDVPADLRGWGGAPVVLHPEGRVIGMLEAAWPDAGTFRLGVAPIGGVLAALSLPPKLGIPFASLAPGGEPKRKDESVDGALALEGAPGVQATGPDGPLLGKAGALSTNLQIEIEYPEDGDYFGDEQGGFLAGRALAMLGEFKRFDVVLVLDTSDSTSMTSGSDLNGNGVISENRMGGLFGTTDPGDSILAAEIAAAKRVLANLDPRNTRVALVTFSGKAHQQQQGGPVFTFGGSNLPDSLTEQELTTNYALVERALEHVRQRGPAGSTNMTEGLRLAIRELKGFRGALSTPDPESEKVVLFFTDGQPTLPYDGYPAANVRSVVRAAGQARRVGVKVHSFAVGPEALAGPVAAVEMATVTGGYFTPVRDPGDLVEVIENVSFANIEELSVRNATTNQPASELITAADGSYSALVPLRTGENVLEVSARASDGTEATAQVTVNHAPGATTPQLPKELVVARNKLLERRLVNLKRGRIEAEREVTEKTRKELELEIERERTAAQDSVKRQRRELEIEAERTPQPAGDEEEDASE